MPQYEFICGRCGQSYFVIAHAADDAAATCPVCQSVTAELQSMAYFGVTRQRSCHGDDRFVTLHYEHAAPGSFLAHR